MANKKNIIVTSIILAIALVVTIITGIQFSSFRYYETEFVLRDGSDGGEVVVDEVIKFHQYSKHLEGTVGDSTIYGIYGTENTVALVATSNAATYATEVPANAKICYVAGQTTQLNAAKATLGDTRTYTELASVEAAVAAVKEGTYDLAIMRHADAKVQGGDVVIAGVEVEKVPSMLVMGGTHPNEPSGQLTATVFLENANVERGVLYVVTETNRSAYSHSQPQESSAWYYEFEVEGTTRKFKYGSRATNTVDQWPSPDVYSHSSGQQLSATEVRNLNRAYPGSETGTYSEQIAWAITNFVLQRQITIVIDLHEASPEYAVNNACVYHQDSGDLAGDMQNWGFNGIYDSVGSSSQVIKCEVSAPKLRGLTHRELGDFTGAYVFLFETSNASQGKLHGKFTNDLICYENGFVDKFYDYAWKQTKLFQESGGEKGIKLLEAPAASISERVARHTDSIMSVVDSFNKVGKTRDKWTYSNLQFLGVTPESYQVGRLVINNIPSYNDLFNNGVGSYLLPSAR